METINQQNKRICLLLNKIRDLKINSNSGKSYLNEAVENLEEALKENYAFYIISQEGLK